MSFEKWWDKNSRKLGVVSLGYDLNKCWRASRAETKAAFKRKVLRIINQYARGDDWTVANDIEEKIKNL